MIIRFAYTFIVCNKFSGKTISFLPENFFALFLFLFFGFASFADTIPEKKIKERKIYSLYYKEGGDKPLLDSTLLVEQRYTENGKLIGESLFNNEGYSTGKTVAVFDDKGNKIEETKYHPDGSIRKRMKYLYDDKGRCVSEGRYNQDGSLVYRIGFVLDDKGRKTEETSYGEGDAVNWKKTYRYHVSGKVSEETEYTPAGKIKDRVVRKFDNRGNLIEEIRTEENEKPVWRFVWKYEGNKNTEELKYYGEDVPPWRITFRYNKLDSLTEAASYDLSGKLMEKKFFAYDNTGNKTEEMRCDTLDRVIVKTVRVFDARKAVVAELSFVKDTIIQSVVLSRYDSRVNLIEKTSLSPAGYVLLREVYQYNTQNKITGEQRFIEGNKADEIILRTFDVYGNITEEIRKRGEQLQSWFRHYYIYY
jgi:hypothetical protein